LLRDVIDIGDPLLARRRRFAQGAVPLPVVVRIRRDHVRLFVPVPQQDEVIDRGRAQAQWCSS